jgi:hypothetical protein
MFCISCAIRIRTTAGVEQQDKIRIIQGHDTFRVFTEVTFGIPRDTELYAEVALREIARNFLLFNSAYFRIIP